MPKSAAAQPAATAAPIPADQIPDRALTILEPWAWAIAAGFKPVENRRKSTSYRGPVAIHTSKSNRECGSIDVNDFLCDAHPAIESALNDPRIGFVADAGDDADAVDVAGPALLRFGEIIGTAIIVDCIDLDEFGMDADFDAIPAVAAAVAAHNLRSRADGLPLGYWANGPFCYLLASPRRFRRPIPAIGNLNFWHLNPAQRAAVAAAMRDCLTDPGEPAAAPPPDLPHVRKAIAAKNRGEAKGKAAKQSTAK